MEVYYFRINFIKHLFAYSGINFLVLFYLNGREREREKLGN